MRILALDLSTHTGFAVLDGPEALITAGTQDFKILGEYPYAHIDTAGQVAEACVQLVQQHKPELVVVEETSRGYGHAQKVLEFIHCRTLLALWGLAPVYYIQTGTWRAAIDLRLSKDQRKNNRRVSEVTRGKTAGEASRAKRIAGLTGRVTSKHLAVAWVNEHWPELKLQLKDNNTADAICIGAAFFIIQGK